MPPSRARRAGTGPQLNKHTYTRCTRTPCKKHLAKAINSSCVGIVFVFLLQPRFGTTLFLVESQRHHARVELKFGGGHACAC